MHGCASSAATGMTRTESGGDTRGEQARRRATPGVAWPRDRRDGWSLRAARGGASRHRLAGIRRRRQWNGRVHRERAVEQLVLTCAGGVERLERLAAGARGGERTERPAGRLPSADRGQQPDPGFLGNIAAVTATRHPQPADGGADQRLVAAQQLLLSAPIIVLRGIQQRAFVKRGGVASRMRGSHARAR